MADPRQALLAADGAHDERMHADMRAMARSKASQAQCTYKRKLLKPWLQVLPDLQG